MNEVIAVKKERDNGIKDAWGAKQIFYDQDGKKLTLRGKVVLGLVSAAFVVSSCYLLMTGPSEMEVRSPITFNGVTSSSSSIDVPPMATIENTKQRKGNSAPRQYSGLEVISRPHLGQIPPGTFVKAKFVTGASNGLVKAVLTEDLLVNGDGIANTGTVLVGTGSSTEERLMVDFNKMVFSDGTVQNVRAQACDKEDQMVGVKGSKMGKYASLLAAGVALNFAGGLAEGLQESEVRSGVAIRKPDLKNAALNGAGKASLEQSKEIIEKWKQQKTIIQVKEGTEICIIFDGE